MVTAVSSFVVALSSAATGATFSATSLTLMVKACSVNSPPWSVLRTRIVYLDLVSKSKRAAVCECGAVDGKTGVVGAARATDECVGERVAGIGVSSAETAHDRAYWLVLGHWLRSD